MQPIGSCVKLQTSPNPLAMAALMPTKKQPRGFLTFLTPQRPPIRFAIHGLLLIGTYTKYILGTAVVRLL